MTVLERNIYFYTEVKSVRAHRVAREARGRRVRPPLATRGYVTDWCATGRARRTAAARRGTAPAPSTTGRSPPPSRQVCTRIRITRPNISTPTSLTRSGPPPRHAPHTPTTHPHTTPHRNPHRGDRRGRRDTHKDRAVLDRTRPRRRICASHLRGRCDRALSPQLVPS